MSELDFLDGNTLGGVMSEVFVVDVTAASFTCATCGRTGPVAELRLYDPGLGLVARCPGCEEVVVRYVRTPAAAMLDLQGTTSLRIPLGPST